MHITLTRKQLGPDATIGDLAIDGQPECHTLEDVVREVASAPVSVWKIPGKTAIPRGTYQVVIDFSSRFQRLMPHVLDVPGFTGIRIHRGNTDRDTEGCILLGSAIAGPDMITGSTIAFDAFYLKLQAALDAGNDVWITIS